MLDDVWYSRHDDNDEDGEEMESQSVGRQCTPAHTHTHTRHPHVFLHSSLPRDPFLHTT